VEETLRMRHSSAGEALLETARRFAGTLSASGSVYLRERVLDIEDVAARLIAALYGTPDAGNPVRITEDAVCVAESLAPSDFIALDRRHVRGLVLSRGGVTSHTAILARAFAIPCVTGIPGIHRTVRQGEDLIVDADRALVILAGPEPVRRFYDRESLKLSAIRESLERHANLPGVSSDGKRLEIAANAASLEEVGAAFVGGAEGIGLFRTEMLFMGKEEPPGEEEQYAVYAEVAACASGRPVIIRTLDIGGDKPLPSLRIPPEENPFLGYRAIRLYAEYPALIKDQLHAILRASAHGSLKVMFPMVCSLHEVRAMKQLIREQMNELDAAGTPFDRRIPVGIMVEIPSVAFILDQLALEVDFFSIGSNDLTQYFLAVDRTNRSVASLYTPFHPSFLRLLKQIIDGAHSHGKWIGLCGEMGGNPLAAPLFLGYGIDEISLSPSLIPAVKDVVRRCRVPDCVALLSSVAEMEGPGEVESALRDYAATLRGSALVAEDIVRLSSPSASKEEAIRELVDMLHAAARVDDPDAVEDAVWLREETYPTAMGYGVAIPHCKSPGVAVTSIAVLKLDAPVFWKMPDQDPVQFLILIVVAASAKGDEHLKIIAGLARRLVHEEFRRKLMDATAPRAIVELLEHRET
jgi:multiphosphoryl transfer protein